MLDKKQHSIILLSYVTYFVPESHKACQEHVLIIFHTKIKKNFFKKKSPNFRNVKKLCIATLMTIPFVVFPFYLCIYYNDFFINLKQNITYHHQVYILYIIIIVIHYYSNEK